MTVQRRGQIPGVVCRVLGAAISSVLVIGWSCDWQVGVATEERICLVQGRGHTGMCISVYSSWPSLSSKVGSASSASSWNRTHTFVSML